MQRLLYEEANGSRPTQDPILGFVFFSSPAPTIPRLVYAKDDNFDEEIPASAFLGSMKRFIPEKGGKKLGQKSGATRPVLGPCFPLIIMLDQLPANMFPRFRHRAFRSDRQAVT